MRSSLLIAAMVALLAGCAGARPVATQGQRDEAEPAARAERPKGRPAGVQIIQFGWQRTFWVMHCPTDSPSPLREQCSLTRAEDVPE
jgi:hypothetical protein